MLAGSSPFILTVNGANFATHAAVLWNGVSLPTTFVSDTQLTASVSGSMVASSGSASIVVMNSSPGGGQSSSLPFPIFQVTALDANSLIFEPFSQRIIASVPSTASQLTGNSIVMIDPKTGQLGMPMFVGSEPKKMALSDDGQYLYVVLSGSNQVQRIVLQTMKLDTLFTTTDGFSSNYSADDLAVEPGNPNVLATVGYAHGIQLWNVTSSGATAIPGTNAGGPYEGGSLAWADANNLYSNDSGLSPSTFHRFAVSSNSYQQIDGTYLDAVAYTIVYSGGLVYSFEGGVIDASPPYPQSPQLKGKFPLYYSPSSLVAEASMDRAFFLSANGYNVSSHTISSFDATRFTSLSDLQLVGATGDAFDLVRWGSDGLAFRTVKDFWGNGSEQIVMLQGASVLPVSPTANPVPAITSVNPASISAGAGNTWVTITGSQFVPGSVAQWNGSTRTTKFVNSGQLNVAIPWTDLNAPGVANLIVVNPTPGGGTSNSQSVTIN